MRPRIPACPGKTGDENRQQIKTDQSTDEVIEHDAKGSPPEWFPPSGWAREPSSGGIRDWGGVRATPLDPERCS